MSLSHKESNVESINGYIDTEFSSGDSNKMKSKQHYQEENNNEIDELSKDLSEMGCIVNGVKRPPNICVETCVYESDSEDVKSKTEHENEDDAYSDEFEEDKSDDEEESIKTVVKSAKSYSTSGGDGSRPSVKLSKSQSTVSSKPPSISGRSSGYGSVSVPQTRRINMSFTNERLREIERHNHILLNKIMCARNNRKFSVSSREQSDRRMVPPAAVQRKQHQRQIDHDNMILLRKIQRTKSSMCSIRR